MQKKQRQTHEKLRKWRMLRVQSKIPSLPVTVSRGQVHCLIRGGRKARYRKQRLYAEGTYQTDRHNCPETVLHDFGENASGATEYSLIRRSRTSRASSDLFASAYSRTTMAAASFICSRT